MCKTNQLYFFLFSIGIAIAYAFWVLNIGMCVVRLKQFKRGIKAWLYDTNEEESTRHAKPTDSTWSVWYD